MREPDFQQLTIRAYQHIEKLAGEIGTRGSCTNDERRGSEYVRENFQKIGLDEIEIQDFKGSPSSYSRYALAFAVALLSQLLAGLRQSEWIYAFSAMIHAVESRSRGRDGSGDLVAIPPEGGGQDRVLSQS